MDHGFCPYRIKICGIRSEEDLRVIISSSSDADLDIAAGFIVGATHFTEDEIFPEKAAKLAASARIAGLIPVMVTHLTDADEILRLLRTTGCSAVQLQDHVPVSSLLKIRSYFPGPVIKAVHANTEDAAIKARIYSTLSDALVMDTLSGNRIGGTGLTHDWSVSKKIVESLNVPVLLAGGLAPENLEDAILTVRPWGIDVNSGVEDSRGNKDPERVRNFIITASRVLKKI